MMKTKDGKINNNHGMTMVEILVSFVILVFLLTAFYGIVRFAGQMLEEATDTKQRTEAYKCEYYKTDKGSLNKTDITPSGATFALKENTTKTNTANKATGASVALNHMAVVEYTGDGSTDPLNERLRVDAYEYR